MTDLVRYDVSDRVATLTLNRPDAMNALTVELGQELRARLDDAATDPGVGCAVLTGAGKGFCAGDDMQDAWTPEVLGAEMAKLSKPIPKPTEETMHLVEFEKPLVAAVNGVAVGVGLDLALHADIRLANQYAKFGALYVNFNLLADFGSLRKLPQLVGPSRAAELLFTGDMVDATEAERIGLVSRVVDAKELLGEAQALAAKIASKPPVALQYMKAGLRMGTFMTARDLADLGAYIGRTFPMLFASADFREAVAAFMEGREPKFTGN
jgi:enoyl-CoA hydratase/carnithine racemase